MQSCDFAGNCNASAIHNDGYDYDQTGNVASISDRKTGDRSDRTMTYDGLDRLTQAVSPMFGTATYAYDMLDNLPGPGADGSHGHSGGAGGTTPDATPPTGGGPCR